MVGPSSHDAAGLRALLADRVEVAYDAAGRGRGLRIVVNVGTMAHFCVQDRLTGFGRYFTEAWTTRAAGAKFRAVASAADKPGGQRVQYDAVTGRVVHETRAHGVGWTGHLQETIPLAVYSICPRFPDRGDLGFEVNLKQKSTDYRELVAQDPGAVLKGLTADPFVGPSSHDAAGLRSLLADRVEVAYHTAGRGWGLRIKVNVGTMAHICIQDQLTGFGQYVTEAWTTRPAGAEFRAVVTPAAEHSGQSVQYTALTGQLIKGDDPSGVLWVGHIQETIPQAVYSLCPSFPDRADLGFEVNPKQTSTDYQELVAQDPGAVLKGLLDEPFVGPSSHNAAGLRVLLTDRVEVAYDAAGRGLGLRIVVNVGTMGHFCVQDGIAPLGRYFTEAWTMRPRGAEFRAVVTPADEPTGWLMQYTAVTGRLVKGGPTYGVLWAGHMQETIPRAVYSLCPRFPDRRDLGFEVNPKQKSTDYRELVAQDPGAVLKGL